MTDLPDIAGFMPMTQEELDQLLAELRKPPEDKPRTPEQQWRHDYRLEMRRRREIGTHLDLFGQHVTHYRRHPKKPSGIGVHPPGEPFGGKLARIAAHRNATYGPERPERPTYPTDTERRLYALTAANWLRLGQRVRIVDAPGAIDPRYRGGRIGREGVIWRLCSAVFYDHVYVFLDPLGAERTDKIEMVELRDIEPLAD